MSAGANATITMYPGNEYSPRYAVVEITFPDQTAWACFRVEGGNRYERGYSAADISCRQRGVRLERFSRV